MMGSHIWMRNLIAESFKQVSSIKTLGASP